MTIIEKIIDLIKNDKKIAENLFLFSRFPTNDDVKIWTGNFDYSDVEWLMVTDQPNHCLVGFNKQDLVIWSIDEDSDFHKACDSFQDLVYEILRLECAFTDNETVKDYFEKYQEEGYQETLERYEHFCKENNIELDKYNIYHDEEGNLFKKSFSKDN